MAEPKSPADRAKASAARRLVVTAPPAPEKALEKLAQLRAEAAASAAAAAPIAGRAAPATKNSAGGADAVAPAAPSQSPVNDREAGLLALLKLEAEARKCVDTSELALLIVNQTRRLVQARQMFVLARQRGDMRLVGVTALPVIDRTAPLTQTIESIAAHLESAGQSGKTCEFRIAAYATAGDETAASYPLQDAVWVPFTGRGGDVFGGVILTRELPWQEREIVIATRLAGTFAHAWQALAPVQLLSPSSLLPGRRATLVMAAALAVLGFVPVSLTTLAPVEIVPRDPFVVAAPIDGVVENVPVEANSSVEPGTLLVKFESTMLGNKLEVAEREVQVAAARLKTTTQLAFADESGRHELAVARADLQLKIAERDFARDLLSKTEIRAPRAGLAVLGDKKELIGRPMSVGQRILEIADPRQVEARIEVPVADAIILKPGARAKLLLDANPLGSIEAKVTSTSYQARLSDAQVLSFRITAALENSGAASPRLGARGTAQIYGERVPLGFYLLRRPFAKIRQWTGL